MVENEALLRNARRHDWIDFLRFLALRRPTTSSIKRR